MGSVITNPIAPPITSPVKLGVGSPYSVSITALISPTGGTLIWSAGMQTQEHFKNVYRTGLRQNTERY